MTLVSSENCGLCWSVVVASVYVDVE
jgi:hypothetical protein